MVCLLQIGCCNERANECDRLALHLTQLRVFKEIDVTDCRMALLKRCDQLGVNNDATLEWSLR